MVQTDVTVVDKRGRFVEGLSAEDFELRVDSKLQSLSFFEQVRAGSIDEEKQLTAARKGDAIPGVKVVRTPAPVGDGLNPCHSHRVFYQVRVAVRDRQTGRTGSVMTWIEIPLD